MKKLSDSISSSSSDSDEDHTFMRKALSYALKGFPFTSPNPLVGCVVVKKGLMLSSGYHQCFGQAHAEVNALKKLSEAKLKGSTVYVSLEPCSHQGKTPPCVDLLIKSKVARVVVAMKDPNPLVNGKGIAKLRAAGIEVKVGVCEEEARSLNSCFLYPIENKKTFVALKLAQTLDGRICDGEGSSQWISSSLSRIYAHKLRTHYQAIMVGIKTVLADNPRLSSRLAGGRNPVRIVLDPKLEVPLESDIVASAKEIQSIIVTSKGATTSKFQKKKELLKEKGVQLIEMELKNSQFKISDLMKKLYSQGIFSLMIEGGAEVAASFLKAGVVRKCHFFIAPKILGDGKTGLNDLNIKSLKSCLRLKNLSFQRFEDDMLMSGDL